MKLRSRKFAVLLLAAALAMSMTAGCGKQSESEKEKAKNQTEQKSNKVSIPKGEKMTEELVKEFAQINDLETLCSTNGIIRIESGYYYPDETGELQTGGKDLFTYQLTDKGVVCEDKADNFYSYYDGAKQFYSKSSLEGEEGQPTESYDITYYSSKSLEEVGSLNYGIYAGKEFDNDSVYKETDDGYDIYEYYDYEGNGASIIVYHANKDKVIISMESTTYPLEGKEYVDTTKKLVLGEGSEPKLTEEYVTGAFTVKVMEQFGTDTENIVEYKVPANTNFFGVVSEGERLSYDPEGTQLIGEDSYDTNLVITKDVTMYLISENQEPVG